MEPAVDEHISAAILEAYSLHKLDLGAMEGTECHLLACTACCDRLAALEPFKTIHYTKDGPFYSRMTRMRSGSFFAHHWGCQIDGGGFYLDLSSARKYLLDSFAQMFPEHDCCSECCYIDAIG